MPYIDPLSFFSSNESLITGILLFVLIFAIMQLSVNQIFKDEQRRFGIIIAAIIAAISTYSIIMMGASIDSLILFMPYIAGFVLVWVLWLSIIHFTAVEKKWIKFTIFIGLIGLLALIWWFYNKNVFGSFL